MLEPTTNCGAPLESPFALTERSPQGVVVPIPTFPTLSIVTLSTPLVCKNKFFCPAVLSVDMFKPLPLELSYAICALAMPKLASCILESPAVPLTKICGKPLPWTVNSEEGVVVPMPTFPPLGLSSNGSHATPCFTPEINAVPFVPSVLSIPNNNLRELSALSTTESIPVSLPTPMLDPATWSLDVGEVVPIPTLPVPVILNFSSAAAFPFEVLNIKSLPLAFFTTASAAPFGVEPIVSLKAKDIV